MDNTQPQTLLSLKYVNDKEQADPHYINKVPVPARRLECKLVIVAKVSLHDTEEHDNQHDRSKRYMETMKPGQHEECIAINTRI